MQGIKKISQPVKVPCYKQEQNLKMNYQHIFQLLFDSHYIKATAQSLVCRAYCVKNEKEKNKPNTNLITINELNTNKIHNFIFKTSSGTI